MWNLHGTSTQRARWLYPDSKNNLRRITYVILLYEKFLQFDWLRAVVFQLNLKYLHVKITVFMVTKITKQIQKQWRKDFQIFNWKRFKNWRKIQKTKTRRKVRQPGWMSSTEIRAKWINCLHAMSVSAITYTFFFYWTKTVPSRILLRYIEAKWAIYIYIYSLARAWGECFHWPMGLKRYKNLTWQTKGRHDQCTDSPRPELTEGTMLLQHPPPLGIDMEAPFQPMAC